MITKEQVKVFEELARPLVKFLNDNCNPHSEIVIDCASARILSGECSVSITEYILDKSFIGISQIQTEELAIKDSQQLKEKICAHYVQFEDCVFFPGDMSCGKKACAVKPRRLSPEIVESNSSCEYCVFNFHSFCAYGKPDKSCFKGRRLSPIA
jgi:hypothetical protein